MRIIWFYILFGAGILGNTAFAAAAIDSKILIFMWAMLLCKFVVVISIDAFCCYLFVVVFGICPFARTKKQKRETKKKMGCVAFVSCPPEFGLSLPV